MPMDYVLTMNNENFTIFLDFDGVLHRKMNGTFEFVHNLIEVLNIYPNADVVISSSWRNTIHPQFFAEIFGVYSSRIVGVTPYLPTAIRENEILKYVRSHHIQKFIAIDDDCRNNQFSKTCPWLFKTNYFIGLNKVTTDYLLKFIYTYLSI